jgi:hypothetical protein
VNAARVAPEKLVRTSLPRLLSCGLHHADVPMLDDHDDRDDRSEIPSSVKILFASLVKLGDELEVAFESDPGRDDVKYERARYIHALRAMSDFLRVNNAPLNYARRLNRLAVALNDLNDGKTDMLLAQSSFGSVNAGATTVEWTGRANAALGMAVLVAAGANRQGAAKTARRKISVDVEVKKYLSWYDQFRAPAEKSKIKNSLARALFDEGRSLIDPEITPAASKKLADYFFALATTLLRKQT